MFTLQCWPYRYENASGKQHGYQDHMNNPKEKLSEYLHVEDSDLLVQAVLKCP